MLIILFFLFVFLSDADTSWRDRTDDLILNPRSPARDAGLFIQIFRCGVKKKDLWLYFVNSVTKGLQFVHHSLDSDMCEAALNELEAQTPL